MLLNFNTYTVESVTAGHPDKICDQISDAVLDECLSQDPMSRVAVETFGSHRLLVVGGELTTKADVDVEKIARKTYKKIGYKDKLRVITEIIKQSPDIAQGVDHGGAGDQGIMYGYATDETEEFLPHGIVLVHQLTRGLEELRTKGGFDWIKPDGKAQVTILNGQIKTVLVSTQHDEQITQEEIRKLLIKNLLKSTLGSIKGIKVLVNPTGKFVVGGFTADTGLTGRKIMVDTYGGLIPHGGGCFSGKDATKVDRSGAYMARFAAKNLVASGFGKKVLVAVSYAIGKEKPLMVYAVNEKGKELGRIASRRFDFRPLAIIDKLDLRKPIFSKTSTYGHFGKKDLSWEQIN